LAGEQFDAVVSVMVLQEMLDFAPAIGEMRRVLRPGGSLVVAVSHPASTMLLSTVTGALTVGHEYGSRTAFVRTKTIDDLTMVYTGYQHSVAHYFNALRDNRFDITALDEVKWASDPLWSQPPRFLHLKAVAR
jgi:ubiquinone/menaquinone biosynthesis C-methylase UbiE